MSSSITAAMGILRVDGPMALRWPKAGNARSDPAGRHAASRTVAEIREAIREAIAAADHHAHRKIRRRRHHPGFGPRRGRYVTKPFSVAQLYCAYKLL
jgi:hypothetical protein